MLSDKKLIAAAGHTAGQAKAAWRAVDAARDKVRRAQAQVDAAEEAVAVLEEQAEEAQQVANDAREAASGLPAFANAEVAEIGVDS